VTCVATRFGFVRIEQQWKPRRQRSFVYVALTVGCLFSRLALGWPGGGFGGRCGEDNREDLRVRRGWLLCNISGLLPMSRFASAFPKQNVACVVTTSALLHWNSISCVIRDKYIGKERWRIEKITRLGSLLCRVDGVEVEWQSAMRNFFATLFES
jgi:hypothetical protein